MEELTQQLARRDRMQRGQDLAKSPQQRMDEMARLQSQAWAVLRSSPDGYAHFIRRNFKMRAVRVHDGHPG